MGEISFFLLLLLLLLMWRSIITYERHCELKYGNCKTKNLTEAQVSNTFLHERFLDSSALRNPALKTQNTQSPIQTE
jgi:hypothetical protein